MNSQNNILLSVIVPIFNGEKHLQCLIDSISNNRNKNFEVLLINDGSTDSTEKICNRAVESDPRFRCVSKKNGGVCSARNMGIELAKGTFITFADQDDWYEEFALDNLMSKIETKTDFIVFQPNIAKVYEDKILKDTIELPVNSAIWEGDLMLHNILLPYVLGYRDNYKYFNFGLWNCIFKKSFLDKNELRLDPYLRMGEDITFISQVLAHASLVQTIKCTYYNWRVNPNSVSHTYVKSSDLSIIKSIYIIQKQTDALSRLPKDLWINDIAAKYAYLIISFSRNWVNKKSGETFLQTVKKIKSLLLQEELRKHINDICISKIKNNRRAQIDSLIIKTKIPLIICIYAKLINLLSSK